MRLESRATRGKKKKPRPKYIFVKFQNISDKENIIKAISDKENIIKAIREEKQFIFKN